MVKHALLLPNGLFPMFGSPCLIDYGGNVSMPSEFAFDPEEQWPDSFPAYYNNDQFDGWFYLTSLQHMEIWLHDT